MSEFGRDVVFVSSAVWPEFPPVKHVRIEMGNHVVDQIKRVSRDEDDLCYEVIGIGIEMGNTVTYGILVNGGLPYPCGRAWW